jgi:hypothetical protein
MMCLLRHRWTRKPFAATRPPTAPEELTLRLGRRQRRRPLVLDRGLLRAPEPLQQVRTHGVERLIALKLELLDELERGGRPLELADRDRG